MRRITVQRIRHKLVAVSGNEITTRCGETFKKPKAGFGRNVVSFDPDCPDCLDETERMLTT